MSNKVIEFVPTKKEAEELSSKHMTGDAVCMACKEKWIAVAPVGTTELECPSCHTLKGHFVFMCLFKGSYYECRCGNDLFRISEEHIYCPNCGIGHRPYD